MQSKWDSRGRGRKLTLAIGVALLASGVGVRAARANSAEAWGINDFGQLGDGTTTNSSTPVPVTGLSSGVTAVASGVTHSLAMQNGSLYAWGTDSYGELGNGTTTTVISTPVPVSGMSGSVSAFSAGYSYSMAVQNGSLYAWGWNAYGQLGNGTYISSSTPVPVTGMSSGVTAIVAGDNYSMAVQNGALYDWGANAFGQLGNGTTATYGSRWPVAVTGLSSGVTAAASSTTHSLAIQNGGLYAWGDNQDGQLGDVAYGNVATTPVAVPGMSSGVTAIAAGNGFSLAVQNGGVYAWGANADGALGDGTTFARFTPERIDPTDLTNIVAVAAGESSSYALAADGTIWDWGSNYDNVLAQDGATSSYLTPQHLLPPNGYVFTSISAGRSGDPPYGDFALATLAPVPEPASLSLLALGGLALMIRRRRPSPRDAFAIGCPEV